MNELSIFMAGIDTPRHGFEVRAYGIDLGTTNSSVAMASWMPGQKPQCQVLEIDQPLWPVGYVTSPLVPSVVALMGNGSSVIGEGAKILRASPQETNLFPERNLFYETKNDIGLRKTYYRAPEAFDHSSKIAGHILRFLKEALQKNEKKKTLQLNVTVPASFQLNQCRDTLLACKYAGLKLQEDNLLDEPTAALIDYIMSEGSERLAPAGSTTHCVVFDFGGGTCDVSVLEITADKKTRQLLISQIAVSRYHRLGGGDLDAAIVHEYLIPALLEKNNLAPLELTWAEKKRVLEPQLLSTAEALKEAICREIEQVKRFGNYDTADKENIIARQPDIDVSLGKRTFHLARPTLSAAQWESLLAPFLDRDLLYARQTDYRLTQSIFAPLQDALDRAGLKPEDIDFCMMAGGSSLIPQVRQALKDYFSRGIVVYFKDPKRMQVAVARGAAWNSLYKAITGKNLIRPVLHEGLSLVTQGDILHPLIPAQSYLPYPGNGDWARVELEVPPQKSAFIDSLLFKVLGTKEKQTIFHEIWDIPGSVAAGEEIVMEYRITAGKEFQCQVYLKEDPDVVFEHTVENPLVNIVNPGSIRLLIEEKEEELKKVNGGSEENRDDFVQLAEWYAELNQKERALNWLKTALHKLGRSDGTILNLQGNYYGELGDHAREEKFYREADKAAPNWGGPLFNLALSFYNRGIYKEAIDNLEQAMKKDDRQGPYLTLKAMCLERRDDGGDQKALYNQAIKAFGPPAGLSDWELGWYMKAAQKANDAKAIKAGEKENEKRRKKDDTDTDEEITLPKIKGGALQRRFG